MLAETQSDSDGLWDVIVVGGGAAGLWAAGTAAARGLKTLVLEKNNKPGVKILISGGTRCNITHDCDIRGIIDGFGAQGRFLKAALYALPPEAVVAEFNSLGVATKVEDSGKVFPVSDRAIDVRDALVRRLSNAGAELRCGTGVTSITVDNTGEAAYRVSADREGEKMTERCRQLLLCCGGLSYPGCGTTGDGYAWARELGHSTSQTFPALTPLVSPAKWVHELTGLTLPDAQARVLVKGKRLKEPRSLYRGGFLWTHVGCSGPVPMNVSRWVSSAHRPAETQLEVDLIPDLDEEVLNSKLQQLGKRGVAAFVGQHVPRRVAATVLELAGVDAELTGAELPKAARQKLVASLKRLVVPLGGTRGYAKAEVTAGGVSTKEVDPKTMRSRMAEDLYFAGEILDFDGPIGGFNFQAAFSTGHLAALSMSAPG